MISLQTKVKVSLRSICLVENVVFFRKCMITLNCLHRLLHRFLFARKMLKLKETKMLFNGCDNSDVSKAVNPETRFSARKFLHCIDFFSASSLIRLT